MARTHTNRQGGRIRRLVEPAGDSGYRAIPGNLAVHILRRDEGEVAHFITFSLWESLSTIETFAGTPADQAKYYPEDREFLLEFEPKVLHWEVTASASSD